MRIRYSGVALWLYLLGVALFVIAAVLWFTPASDLARDFLLPANLLLLVVVSFLPPDDKAKAPPETGSA